MQTSHPAPQAGSEPYDALDRGLGRLMWLEQKRLAQILSDHDLTVPQFLVLATLAHGEQGCTIGTLAGRLFQSNATMTGIIDRLEAERLVVRLRDDENDRRKVKVQVTHKGRALLERAMIARHEQIHRALAGFEPEDVHAFIRLLNTYVSELEKES